jgi:hypothetical protein
MDILAYGSNFCAMKKSGAIGRLLTIMNKRHNTIKFTHEQENANVWCFFDIEIKRVDNNLKFNVFHKPTAVPRYITASNIRWLRSIAEISNEYYKSTRRTQDY